MTKRTYRYRQWLRYVKEHQLIDSGYYGIIPMIERASKNAHLYDPGETFMGLVPYIQAKKNGIPVSEFQDRFWAYGSGKTTTLTVKPENHWNNYNGL